MVEVAIETGSLGRDSMDGLWTWRWSREIKKQLK